VIRAGALALLVLMNCLAPARAAGRFVCPDAWIDDRMPRVVAPGARIAPRDYFIVAGRRRAIRPGERERARRRCGLEPRIVW
jgi:hypothetical protein